MNAFCAPSQLVPGEILADKYQISRLLSQGAMGWVYLARVLKTNKRVVVKQPKAELFATESGRVRFRNEAAFTKLIQHRNVVGFRDYVIHEDDTEYLVLEYANSGTLAELMSRTGHLPIETALRIACGLARGLVATHTAGIAHLDVKPANILLERGIGGPERGRRVMLCDYGLARYFGTEMNGGTPQYMSPEQLWHHPASAQSDQYAFGVILYQLLTGQPPHSGKNLAEIVSRKQSTPADPRTHRKLIPESIAKLTLRLLETEPTARFADTGEILDRLEHLLPEASEQTR